MREPPRDAAGEGEARVRRLRLRSGLRSGHVACAPLIPALGYSALGLAAFVALDAWGLAAITGLTAAVGATLVRLRGAANELGPAARRVRLPAAAGGLPQGRAWALLAPQGLAVQTARLPRPASWLVPWSLAVGLALALLTPAAMVVLDIASATRSIASGAGLATLCFVVSITLFKQATPQRLVVPVERIVGVRRDGRSLRLRVEGDGEGEDFDLSLRANGSTVHAFVDRLHAAGVPIDPGRSVGTEELGL